MNKLVRSVAALVVGAAVVLGLTSVTTAASDGAGTASSATSASNCAQLRRRLAGAPATLRRVETNLTDLRARLADTQLPVRRSLVEQRIERLEQLRATLRAKIAQARTACGATGNNTT